MAELPADLHLAERVAQLQPDMIIVDAESDARDVLEHVVFATRDAPRPIALFTEEYDKSNMEAAMNAGVSAYVVAGLQSERIKPVLDVALARFRADQKLRAELSSTKLRLAERKTIERAKGLLMERHKISEEEASAVRLYRSHPSGSTRCDQGQQAADDCSDHGDNGMAHRKWLRHLPPGA
jgi:response regulator NasT